MMGVNSKSKIIQLKLAYLEIVVKEKTEKTGNG